MRVLFLAKAEKDRAKLVQIELSYKTSGRVAKVDAGANVMIKIVFIEVAHQLL